jgi:predicted nucleic acid-binding protein
MKSMVVDASAAVTLLRREPGHETVRSHLARGAAEGQQFLVPPIFWLEIVNVLARRYRYAPAAIVEAVYELEQVGLTTAELGRPGTLAVIDVVARTGLTSYAAAYLVLAESSEAMLLTADAQLAAAAGDRCLPVGPDDGVAEAFAPYAAAQAWPTWKGAAAYLSELRSSLS